MPGRLRGGSDDSRGVSSGSRHFLPRPDVGRRHGHGPVRSRNSPRSPECGDRLDEPRRRTSWPALRELFSVAQCDLRLPAGSDPPGEVRRHRAALRRHSREAQEAPSASLNSSSRSRRQRECAVKLAGLVRPRGSHGRTRQARGLHDPRTLAPCRRLACRRLAWAFPYLRHGSLDRRRDAGGVRGEGVRRLQRHAANFPRRAAAAFFANITKARHCGPIAG